MYPTFYAYESLTPGAPAHGGQVELLPAPPGPDATAEFQHKLNDPSRWIRKEGVPIFKAHQRTDPATGKLIAVDLPKLYRIAQNMMTMEAQGVPIRMTLGHTEPGKPETQQPPIAGFYRNPRVQGFGPKGEPAVVVDEWLDPQYMDKRKNYPYRSSEYYDDTEQITGVALLTRDPFLDLGVVAYRRGDQSHMTYAGRDTAILSYTSTVPDPIRYARAHGGRVPTMYRLNLGDLPMYPQGTPQQPPTWYGPAVPQPQYAAPQPAPIPGYAAPPVPYAAPQQYAAPQYPQPQYAAPQYPQPTPYGRPVAYWDGTQPRFSNSPEAVPHQHMNTGAVYGRAPANYNEMGEAIGAGLGAAGGRYFGGPLGGAAGSMVGGFAGNRMTGRNKDGQYGRYGRAARYAEDEGMPPEQMAQGPGGPPPGPGGPGGPSGGGNVMEELYQCLSQAVQILSTELGGGAGGPPSAPMPPDTPFPSGGGPEGGPPPTPAGRYGRSQGRPQGNYGRVPSRGYYGRYEAPRAPVPYNVPQPRTISGLPVGFQMEIDKLRQENRQMADAMGVVMYERDQADTQACAAEIGKLAAVGFQVGEYEVWELKKKNPQERGAYLQHVMTKYQRIGTEPLPPILGDPTPGHNPQPGPLTQDQMEQVVKMTGGSSDPSLYAQAVEAVRYGRAPQQFGGNRGSIFNNPEAPEVTWGPGAQQQPQHGQNRLQPSANGNGY